jgi:DNA primase
MPQHVPDEVKQRLKREVSIQRLAEARGVKLRRSGKELIGLCPFHDDKNPSLNIDPVKNEWHCKGACGEGGDVFKWVMKAEGISFFHAAELLRSGNFSSAASAGEPPRLSTVRKLPAPVAAHQDDQTLLRRVMIYYHEKLKESPEALKYLAARGLTHPEMLGHFQLGYGNRTLGLRLEKSNRKAGAVRGRLQQLGVMRQSGHEHFNGALVIPILSISGDVLGMYGRKIARGLHDRTPLHMYLPGPHRGVWNEIALQASKEIILCEALIDALTFWCAGYRHVTTSYGVNGFTDDLRAAFIKYGTKRVYIAYDRDDAGERAAVKLAAELMDKGVECFRVNFPKGMDANEYARTTQPAGKALGVLLTSATWLGKGKEPSRSRMEPSPAPEPIAIAETSAEKNQPAAKEENIIAPSTPPQPPTPEPVLPLAADLPVQLPVQSRPMPLATPTEPDVKIDGDEITVSFEARTFRVLGLFKNSGLAALKVNVKISGRNRRGDLCYHGDTLDLQNFRQRSGFVKQAAHELGTQEESIQSDFGKLWGKLEDLQRDNLHKTLETAPEETVLTAEEQDAALELLRDPNLLERVVSDFDKYGVVGEETNKKLAYVAAVSRLLEKPLAIVVQSSSSAGKSSLMDAVLDFMPAEERIQYSAMTGQSLFYMGQKDLKHKILAVSEEEGATRAAYALKLLQSEGVLRIASTGKDPVSGKHVTHDYTVEGPVMIFLTTTAADVDEELLNRSIVLAVNEDREQTQAIHRKQREAQTLDGLKARLRQKKIVKLHGNAQRLLRSIAVVVKEELVQARSFPDYMIRTRRDHMKFLTLISSTALLHQYQRELRTSIEDGETLEYIEASEADVQLAWTLANHVLVRSLDDLPPQTRRLLLLIDKMVTEECARLGVDRSDYRFTRATVRNATRWGDSQLKKHLSRLEDLEYLVLLRGARGHSFVYALNFEMDENGKPVLPGLSYGADRRSRVEDGLSRSEEGLAPSSHGQVTGVSRGGHGAPEPITTGRNGDSGRNHEKRSDTGNGANGHEKSGVVVAAPATSSARAFDSLAKPNGAAKRAGVK